MGPYACLIEIERWQPNAGATANKLGMHQAMPA